MSGRQRLRIRSAGRDLSPPPGSPAARHFTVVKTWFQDDYGLFARFDSLLCQALVGHPRVDRVIHLAPPIPPHELRRRGADGFWEANLDRLSARASGNGFEEDGVWLYSAPVGETLHGAAAARSAEVVRAVAAPDSWLVVVEMLTPHPFCGAVADALPDAIRVAVLEDDHRVGREDRDQVTVDFAATFASAAFGMASSPALLEEFSRSGASLALIPRVTEPEVYANAAPSAELADLSRPIAVYAGWLRDRIDYDLLRYVVDASPDVTFVLVGGGHDIAARELGQRANVVLMGPRSGSSLPSLLAGADVALVPHTVDATTEGMTPDKVIHYLASGLPVVSTAVAGVRTMPAGLVSVAKDAAEFSAKLRASVEENDVDRASGRARRRAAVASLDLRALGEWFVASLDAAALGEPLPTTPEVNP